VTALWDWSPVASWDSGKHWPSWQTPDDGAGMTYFGEGGGCFGVGESEHALCMHHHNVAYSSRCGKNMSRLVVPHGASVAGPEFTRKPGSRSQPSGMVYAPMTMGRPPWEGLTDRALTCDGDADRGDLGAHHTSYECLSHADLGLAYGWYPGVNVAVFRGDTDGHCHLCTLRGNASEWNLTTAQGAAVYWVGGTAAAAAAAAATEPIPTVEKGSTAPPRDYDDDGDCDDRADMPMCYYSHWVNKTRELEWNLPGANFTPSSTFPGLANPAGGNPTYVLKSWNYGANWTWLMLPDFLQGLGSFGVDPTNGSVLYGWTSGCISRSYDEAETWEACWEANGLEGSFKQLLVKDSSTMVVMRNGDVPLRTKDGGSSWQRMISVQPLMQHSPAAAYSWSGKTLALSTVVGRTVVWVSTDDGDTWVDESGDYTADNGGIAQWYGNTLYISSMGQGISSKTFAE
jgi:hypothetical protein